VALLSGASAYPDRPRSVEIIETHISWVFLTDRFVYKLKKPVRFEFLDFSTLELRHRACLEEVRLNRRLAPDAYLSVLPITEDEHGGLELAGGGTPIEWVVQMRRLPADKSLDFVLRNRRLGTEDANAIARHLADFYGELLREPLFLSDYRQTLERHIRANCEALSGTLSSEDIRVRRIQSAQLRYLHVQKELFDERVKEGRIVDGHGDLRPEHIYLEKPPAVIDCIEFSDELRKVDVADELSFLAMECTLLHNPMVAEIVISTYENLCKDRIPKNLLAFYRSYRACVRAKVSAIRAQQQAGVEKRRTEELASVYLAVAESNSKELGPPVLVFVGGLMGSGKSTLAEAIARAFSIEVLSTDRIRRSMLGASPTPANYGEGLYAATHRTAVYDELYRQAADKLASGQSVVLDGTFLQRAQRQRAHETARQHAAESLHVLCECPRDVALSRIQQRASTARNDSEARVELYDQQAMSAEPLGFDERAITVDSTSEVSVQFQAACDALKG